MVLTNKRRVFIEEYLACWNATEAARRAGYKYPRRQGSRLLSIVDIQEKINERIAELKMGADEVLLRLRAQATTDLSEFIDENGIIDWARIKQAVKERGGPLVKKITHVKGRRTSVELYDAQAALALLGRHHKLFTDKVEHAGDPDKPIEHHFADFSPQDLLRLAEACRLIGKPESEEGGEGKPD